MVDKIDETALVSIEHGGSDSGPTRLRMVGGGDYPTISSEATSYLVDETRAMANERRLQEQKGHRRLARVHQRERNNEEEAVAGLEEELQNGPKQHPYLESQRFDGIDPNVSPAPDIGTDARREFDNEKREQEKEKQLRLGLENRNELKNEYRNTNIPDYKP